MTQSVPLSSAEVPTFQPNVREDPVQLVKLENILSLALHLREVAEDFQRKKVRDILDFEWVRNPRYDVRSDMISALNSRTD